MVTTDNLEPHEKRRLAAYQHRGLKPLKADGLPDTIFLTLNEFPSGSLVSTAELRLSLEGIYLSSKPSPQQISNCLNSLVKRGYVEKIDKNYRILGDISEDLEAVVLSSNVVEAFCRTLIKMITHSLRFQNNKEIPSYRYDSQARCIEESSYGYPKSGIHFMLIKDMPRFMYLPTCSPGPERIIETAFEALQTRYATGDEATPILAMPYFKECTKLNQRFRKVFTQFTSQKHILDLGDGHLALSLKVDWFYYANKETKDWFASELERAMPPKTNLRPASSAPS